MDMFKNVFPSRFSIINAFAMLFLTVSSLVRFIFLATDFSQVDHSFLGWLKYSLWACFLIWARYLFSMW